MDIFKKLQTKLNKFNMDKAYIAKQIKTENLSTLQNCMKSPIIFKRTVCTQMM